MCFHIKFFISIFLLFPWLVSEGGSSSSTAHTHSAVVPDTFAAMKHFLLSWLLLLEIHWSPFFFVSWPGWVVLLSLAMFISRKRTQEHDVTWAPHRNQHMHIGLHLNIAPNYVLSLPSFFRCVEQFHFSLMAFFCVVAGPSGHKTGANSHSLCAKKY